MEMPNLIPEDVKILWEKWNLRASILFSLFLQMVLILCAPERKRRRNIYLNYIIWSAYLLADWVAAFTVGLIASNQANMKSKTECQMPLQTEELLAFWAPFLLLHLGGPDAITAFSLEDNELWIRHLFGLIMQLIAVAYVIIQALPSDLWIPTTLMLLVGIIKYAERTRALYFGCLDNFKDNMLPLPDAGPNYAQLTQVYSSKKLAHVPARLVEQEIGIGVGDAADYEVQVQKISEVEQVEGGFRHFNIFKALIVDLMLTFKERKESRKYFFARTTEDAFKVLEVELNFMYDVLYTKMVVVNGKIGYILRFVCSICLLASLERFAAHHHHKHTNGSSSPKMHVFDVYVTYALLIGAICLDTIAVIKLIFSDWTVVRLKSSRDKKFIFKTGRILTTFWRIGRWSNRMSRHSLVRYCLRERFKWIKVTAEWLGLEDFLDEIQYRQSMNVPKDLKDFIFKVLKEKAVKSDDVKAAREIGSARGERVLSQNACYSLIGSVEEEYGKSLLLWHIATDLCFFTEDEDEKTIIYRSYSQILSDYMFYLLVMRPPLMSGVQGIWKIRFQDTCEEARKIFLSHQENKFSENLKNACEKLLLHTETDVDPSAVKGSRSKSVLFDASILAKKLKKLEETKRWKVMSEVWVEMMSYAANCCKPNVHVQHISKGGELLTFVWLLMIQLGLGDHFWLGDDYLMKLIVEK